VLRNKSIYFFMFRSIFFLRFSGIDPTTFLQWPLPAPGGSLLSRYQISEDGKQAQHVGVILGRVSERPRPDRAGPSAR
jgi:hypothetical protein